MAKDKNILIYNIIAMCVVVVSATIYRIVGVPYVFKTLTSMLFVVAGLGNYLFAKDAGFGSEKYKKFALYMFIGLIFAMAGDILLIDFFEIGAGLFAVGHVMFFVAYLNHSKFSLRDVICAVIIFVIALAVILLYPGFKFDLFMLIVVIAYALIISLMLGKAISNLFEKSLNKRIKLIIFIGSLMFFLSDVCLLFNVFAEFGDVLIFGKLVNIGYIFDTCCLALYYPAEVILSASIYYASRD